MSKEVYLKGEQKLEALSVIKTGIAVRLNPKEILEQLAKHGIEISERTLRRLKLEIYQNAGSTVTEILVNQVGGTLIDEILSYEEIERRCWELYYSAKTPNEKFRALSQLRLISQDKIRLGKHVVLGKRMQKLDYTKLRDDLREFHKEGDSETNPS